MARGSFSGVLSPVLSPNSADGGVDAERFQAMCKWQLSAGIDGLAIFGTTSEANSISVSERLKQTEALVASGVPGEKLMPGTGTCSLADTAVLTKQAVDLGAGGVLLLPPFYYKGVSEDGLFAYVAELIRIVADDRLRIYLYHIPPQAVIGWSLPLIQRLVAAFPETIVGLKDSSGDWDNTKAILDNVPDFDVFPGSEMFLLDGLKNGGAGCISATANVNPTGIRAVLDAYAAGDEKATEKANDAMKAVRSVFQGYAPVPALKAAVANFCGDDGWAAVRPPLLGLTADKTATLMEQLRQLEFSIDFGGKLG
ncbi:MAG: dihydrodipicolinate synthase family protein [Pseudomonadota bacterium]|nr:dihydrodipicolinate synthase family protein [Pseudomonadota bacterium]